jgi:cytochrome c oxidase assembly protein subunit 11
VSFVAKNMDQSGATTGKAVYDINPPQAGQYFKKIECFCFREQKLEAGQEMEMPLYFWFDPELPEDIEEITVAYTFFNMESSLSRSMKNRERAAK